MTKWTRRTLRPAVLSGLAAALFALIGCKPDAEKKADLPHPIVSTAHPIERTVTRYEMATGRAAPLEQVEIRARVNGYLKAIHFQPGREVEKGQLLFEIDSEPYKADLARAKASLETALADLATSEADQQKADSRVTTTKAEHERQEALFKQGVGEQQTRNIAKGSYDEASAAFRSAQAKVKLSKAKIDEARATVLSADLNLGYCTISSPITGIVGDKLVTEGNLITGGVGNTTLLTTVVAVEKMDVAFDVDENTLQRIQQAVRDGKVKSTDLGEIPAEAGLALHGTAYPLKGKINFADNQFNPKTGTVRMKARFDNPKPPVGQRLLAAGMYARIRVPIGAPVKAMLVPESAFGSDQGVKFLYLVGPENKAVRVNAALGVQEGEERVVESIDVPGEGKPRPLTTSDQVIVSGLQRLRPGMTVEPKSVKK